MQNSITIVVVDNVKKEAVEEYKKWRTDLHGGLQKFKGYLSHEALNPIFNEERNSFKFHFLIRFDNKENVLNWRNSNFLTEHVKEVEKYLIETTKIQDIEGVELLFAETNQINSPHYIKKVIITIACVYPLVIGSQYILKSIPGFNTLPNFLGTFLGIILVSALMVKPVMPFATSLLKNWLYNHKN